MERIYIIGNSGSGKSYLANKLSEKLNIPHFDLDDVFWKKKYSIQRTEDEKKLLLSKIIKDNETWVIEGLFVSFTDEAIKNATEIIWLDININILTWRIIKREFIKIIKGKNNFKNVFELIKFVRRYNDEENGYYFKIKKLLEKHEVKFILIKNKKDFKNYLKKLE